VKHSLTLPPIHPGEVLREEFMCPLGLSQARVAHDISVPARRIASIVHGKRGVTADTALRLSRFLGPSERFWLNLQAHYDLEAERDRLGPRLEVEVAVLADRAAR
jgi:addiction module HigA family antidote